MDKLSYTLESYLDAIYELTQKDDGARLTDIAARMDVAKSTANSAIASLTMKKLVESSHYSHIHLTEAGVSLAEDITRKHETIRRFFRETLGVDEDTANTDACAIEHIISDKSVSAMRHLNERKAK